MSDKNPAIEISTPEALILKIADILKKDPEIDVELLAILSEHILKISPEKIAVNDAMSDIETLAIKRTEGSNNDTVDHN